MLCMIDNKVRIVFSWGYNFRKKKLVNVDDNFFGGFMNVEIICKS